MSALAPLQSLYEIDSGTELPLPSTLATLYGPLRLPSHPDRPYVMGNFVTTLDGVVALNEGSQSGGGEISGFDAHDRMVMGLLRATADAVIVGAGTLQADADHLWTPEYIYPALAQEYQALRHALGKPEPPLNVIVTAHGHIEGDPAVFRSCTVPVLVVTTRAGERRLARRRLPGAVQIVAGQDSGPLSAGSILEAVSQARRSDVILVEGGPHLMSDFFAERRLDELFLTLAPQIAGRDGAVERPGLVAGQSFAPEQPLWGALQGVKRGGNHLFLRYAFASAT